MNWEVIGALGEWAGALVVAVTLIFLVRQIRVSATTIVQRSADRWRLRTLTGMIGRFAARGSFPGRPDARMTSRSHTENHE